MLLEYVILLYISADFLVLTTASVMAKMTVIISILSRFL